MVSCTHLEPRSSVSCRVGECAPLDMVCGHFHSVTPPRWSGPTSTPRRRSFCALAAPTRPSAFRESSHHVPLQERQQAVLLERLPSEWDEEDVNKALLRGGVDLGEAWRSRVLLMRSRLGRSIGRVVISLDAHVPHVTQGFPSGATYRSMDRYDVEAFVEQSERFVRLSDDLRRLAQPEHFLRTITITGVPGNYGRRDIVNVIASHCNVTVDPRDVVFRFKRWGRQSDTCYVICPTQKNADHCLARIQELAVPKRAAYGSLFGAAFLWSSRGTLFVTDHKLDFLVHDSMSWVFSTGWQEDLQEDDLLAVLQQMRFLPIRAVRYPNAADQSASFFLEFDNMDRTKQAMIRLRRLQRRWQIKPETPFVAYPRRLDIHREHEEMYEDDDSAGDSDLEEPVHY